jgi:hypothetical protein
MIKSHIPRPCIRRVNMPSGEQFSIELPSGNVLANFMDERGAKIFAKKKKLHHDYGRCFFEYAPNKFETFIEDDSGLDLVPIHEDIIYDAN